MRGKAQPLRIPHTHGGITPAYAGKRPSTSFSARSIRDHPRLCGEKQNLSDELKDFQGITPAYAGKSQLCQLFLCFVQGSPPPMRGKAENACVTDAGNRITPAYAGKSVGTCFEAGKHEDHPRLCGEKTKKILKQRYFFHQPASFSFSLQYT